MKVADAAGYKAYSMLPVFRRKLGRARRCISRALELSRAPFVGFSAGKDSACVLALVWEQDPTVPALCVTGGETRLIYPDLNKIFDWWRSNYPASHLEEVMVDKVFAEGWESADWLSSYWAVEGEYGQWSEHLHSRDVDGCFLGLRQDESKGRLLSLKSHRLRDEPGWIFQYCKHRKDTFAGHWRICPIADWTTKDVGAFHSMCGIPLLDAYEEPGLDGRTHLRLGRQAMRMGQLDELRVRSPEGYNRIIARFPELARGWD